VIGGDMDAATRFVAPTIVKNVSVKDPLMAECAVVIFIISMKRVLMYY
jgi:hypothetical protein